MKLLFILIVSLTSHQSFSQLFVGAEIGMNLIKIDEQEVGDNYQPSWYFGGAVEYQINDWFAIQSGVYFSQKKQSYSDRDTSLSDVFAQLGTVTIPGVDLNTYTNTYSRQSQSYLEIPILAAVRWEGLQLFGGGYIGFMVSANRKDNAVAETPFMSSVQLDSLIVGGGTGGGFLTSFLPQAHEEAFIESSDKTNLNGLDYGLKAGIGYQKNKFGFFASYNFGLVDFRKDQGSMDIQKHQYFQFSLRYMFEAGKKGVSSVR